jgi:hypothetical protein
MMDHCEDLLRSGIWLGPAMLGALCYRLLGDSIVAAGDDLAGVVLVATAAMLLTAAGVRFNGGKNVAIAPAVFIAMFVASWSMR